MNQKINIGCQAWGYDDWVSRPGEPIFYPQGTREADKLGLYSEIFDLIELDTAVYGTPQISTIEAWYRKVPPNFIFAPKLPNAVTHRAMIGRSSWPVFDEFCENIRAFREKLGPTMVLLPREFDYSGKNLETVERFFERAPADLRFAVEFRHGEWLNDRTFEILRKFGVALALEEGRGIPDEMWEQVVEKPTADFTYIRLAGPRDLTDFTRVHRNMDADLARWAERIRNIPAKEIFVLFSNFYEGHSPASANKLKALLDLDPTDPMILERQGSLF